MNFFIVILTVIGIDNYVGQATASTIVVTVDSIVDTGSNVVSARHSPAGSEVQFFKTINKGDLTYFMELKMDGTVVDSTEENDSQDFCDDTPEAKILRGALLPVGKTSCPVRKGVYIVSNEYGVDISDSTEENMKCGPYTGTSNVRSGNDTALEIQFTFDLDESQSTCK